MHSIINNADQVFTLPRVDYRVLTRGKHCHRRAIDVGKAPKRMGCQPRSAAHT
jgi:hypothetical protein